MTAEEALSIVETVLEDERLNDVQEIIFKHCWEGRKSYDEIAEISNYKYEYIKSAASMLWKLLSEAFDETVRRSNLQSVVKRYARLGKINLQRNFVIEVNLSGANLSGANLNGARVVANFIETDSSQAISPKVIMPDENIESDEEIVDDEDRPAREVQSESEAQIYYWNELQFPSEEEVKIAEALARTHVLFFPKSKMWLTTAEGTQNEEPDFMIFHQGKSGILEVWYPNAVKFEERDRLFKTHGIHIVEYYDATRCNEQPDEVVQEFLQILSQA